MQQINTDKRYPPTPPFDTIPLRGITQGPATEDTERHKIKVRLMAVFMSHIIESVQNRFISVCPE